MNAFNLYEAYAAVYDEDLREDILTIEEDFDFIDDLSDNELVQVMESILVEGEYTLSECVNIFEDAILIEETELERMNRLGNKIQREKKAKAATATRMKAAERERVGRKHAMKRIQVATGRAAQNLANKAERARVKGAGLVSAVAGGAAEAGRKAKEGAKKVSGKLASAKEKIKGFMGRVGKSLKSGYRAARDEFSGEAGRKANARTTGRRMRRAARNQAAAERGRDTSEFQRPKPPSGPYRNIGAGKKEKAGGKMNEPESTPHTPNKERVARAKKKQESSASGKSSRGVRFAGPKSSQVIGGPTRVQSSDSKPVSRQKAAAKAAKELNLNHYEYLLDPIFEDLIHEGYVDTREDALYFLESLSIDDLAEVLESYDLSLFEQEERDDLYDVVLEHLLDEGYADTEEAATVIMANMSEEWRDEILESRGDGESDRFKHRLTRGVKKVPGQKTSYDNLGNMVRQPYHAQLKKRKLPPYNY